MKKQVWWQPAIIMFARLSAWIIGPVIVGLFIGKWLDNKYQSKPWLFLLSMAIAFVISIVGLIKNTKDEYEKIEAADKLKKK